MNLKFVRDDQGSIWLSNVSNIWSRKCIIKVVEEGLKTLSAMGEVEVEVDTANKAMTPNNLMSATSRPMTSRYENGGIDHDHGVDVSYRCIFK